MFSFCLQDESNAVGVFSSPDREVCVIKFTKEPGKLLGKLLRADSAVAILIVICGNDRHPKSLLLMCVNALSFVLIIMVVMIILP